MVLLNSPQIGTPPVRAIRMPAQKNALHRNLCPHSVCDNFVTSARTEQILDSADVQETRVNTGEKVGGPGRDRTDDLFHAMECAKPYLADGKGFNNRMRRQKPLKSAHFDTKSDTKLGRGGGSSPPLLSGGRPQD
jgi:hypothetical protein